MRRSSLVAVVGGVLVLSAAAGGTPAAAAETATELKRPAPFYMKSERIRDRIDRAGAKGVSYVRIQKWVRRGLAGKRKRDEPVADPCPTFEPGITIPSVHTNACITYPYGCTANFIYKKGPGDAAEKSDGRNYFLGTAGHCVDHSNQPVYADDGAGMVIRVGKVWKHIDGGLGNDMAAVRIDDGLPIEPRMPGVGGPNGVYAGCAGGQSLTWWGHGYGVAVWQGNPGQGHLTRWWDRPYAWAGDALPGDSGSGVVVVEPARQAAGNLTHLVLDSSYFPAVNAGTRMTHYLSWLGGDVRLVNENRTLTDAPRNTGCGNPDRGNG